MVVELLESVVQLMSVDFQFRTFYLLHLPANLQLGAYLMVVELLEFVVQLMSVDFQFRTFYLLHLPANLHVRFVVERRKKVELHVELALRRLLSVLIEHY
jgi:hypothetical protein